MSVRTSNKTLWADWEWFLGWRLYPGFNKVPSFGQTEITLFIRLTTIVTVACNSVLGVSIRPSFRVSFARVLQTTEELRIFIIWVAWIRSGLSDLPCTSEWAFFLWAMTDHFGLVWLSILHSITSRATLLRTDWTAVVTIITIPRKSAE